MPQYSSSPLGLALSSGSTDTLNNVGKYIISASSSGIKSLFANPKSFSFNPITTNYNSYSSSGSDISTTSIIEYTQKIASMSLKYSDFAYLKNLGVYTNNRLIIARRFNSPVEDDLTTLTKDISPVSTLISWVPDNSEFISTDFGEEWSEADASFKDILNDIGHDVLMGDNSGKSLGGALSGGMNLVPLPGFTEGLQYEVFKQLGMTDLDASNLPIGNPNIIRQAKRRNTLGRDTAGSGLHCKFKIDMTVEYEQKFINGVDPTIVYYDIIANALTFGTSEAQFQFKSGSNVSEFDKFIGKLGSGDPAQLKEAMLQFVGAISNAIGNIGRELLDGLNAVIKAGASTTATAQQKNQNQLNAQNNAQNATKKSFFSFLQNVGTKIVQGLVSKYKIRIMGVVNSLTGTPSAPWHVTIGNPRRPIFSSGDMLVTSVNISMGKLLAFNDLPSSIKIKFTLESARNIGSQEIFKKFNCGKERTYIKLKKSFVESDLVLSDTDAAVTKQKLALNQISKSVITGSSYNERTPQVEKVFEINAPAISAIPGIVYNVDTDNKPTAILSTDKLSNSVKDKVTKLDPGSKSIRFDASGRVYSINGDNRKIIGNWVPMENGEVVISYANSDTKSTSTVATDGTIK